MHDRDLLAQEELEPVHPPRFEVLRHLECGIRGENATVPEPARTLHRQGAHVPVGVDLLAATGPVGDGRRDAPAPHLEPSHRHRSPEADAQLAQATNPRIDPHLVRRGVQNLVEAAVAGAARVCVQPDLPDSPDRARARLARLRGEDEVGHALHPGLPVALGETVRMRELGPGHVLPFAEPSGLAARQEDHEPVDEVRGLLRRSLSREEGEQVPAHLIRSPMARVWRVGENRVLATARAGDTLLRRDHDVSVRAVRIGAERDPAHRLRQVLVRAREESSPVLTR